MFTTENYIEELQGKMLEVYLNKDFRTTHERMAFDSLVQELKRIWDNRDELLIVLGNFDCGGVEIDLAMVKTDAILVLELKDYGGEIQFSENGAWTSDNIAIKAAKYDNPYFQIRNYRNSLLDFLADKQSEILSKTSNINWRLANGIVVFHRDFKLGKFPDDFFKRNRWFDIWKLDELGGKIDQLTNVEINLSFEELRKIPESLGLTLMNTKVPKVVSDAMDVESLINSLTSLYEILETENFINLESELLVDNHEKMLDRFEDEQREKIVIYIHEVKLPFFRKYKEQFDFSRKPELINSTLNANATSNHRLDDILQASLTEKDLSDFKKVRSMLNKVRQLSYDPSKNRRDINFNYLSAIAGFTYLRGIFEPKLLAKAREIFEFSDEALRLINGLYEILRTWFGIDMVLHWDERNDRSTISGSRDLMDKLGEQFLSYIKNGEISIYGKVEISLQDSVLSITGDVRPDDKILKISNEISASNKNLPDGIFSINRGRTEHKSASGLSPEWIKNIEEKFGQKLEVGTKSIPILEDYSRSIFCEIEIPLQLTAQFNVLLGALKIELGADVYESFLDLNRLSWIQKKSLSLDDIYLCEIRTNTLFHWSSDIDFLLRASTHPNGYIYEPSYLSILECLGNWPLTSSLSEKEFETTYKSLEKDLSESISDVLNLWEHYKPSYSKNYNYTGTNSLSINPSGYGRNVSAELKIEPNILKEFFKKIGNDRLAQKFKEYSIGDIRYIRALKRFKNDSEVFESHIKPREINKDNATSKQLSSATPHVVYNDFRADLESLCTLIKSPDMREEFGIEKFGGIIMYGPPGCGKTYWAKQLGVMLGYRFREVARKDFASSLVDGAVKGLTKIIDEVVLGGSCVLFFDEFDDIAKSRSDGNSSDSENNKLVNYLLQTIPKLIEKGIVIVAATNFLEKIDTAVIRGGRFDRKDPIFPPMPLERANLLFESLRKDLRQDSRIIQELKRNDALTLEFWRKYGTDMKLFSNSYVENTALEIKKKLYKNFETNPSPFILEDLIIESIDEIRANISFAERQDFQNFYKDLVQNKFTKYPDRIENLRNEIEEFFDEGSDKKRKIGY